MDPVTPLDQQPPADLIATLIDPIRFPEQLLVDFRSWRSPLPVIDLADESLEVPPGVHVTAPSLFRAMVSQAYAIEGIGKTIRWYHPAWNGRAIEIVSSDGSNAYSANIAGDGKLVITLPPNPPQHQITILAPALGVFPPHDEAFRELCDQYKRPAALVGRGALLAAYGQLFDLLTQPIVRWMICNADLPTTDDAANLRRNLERLVTVHKGFDPVVRSILADPFVAGDAPVDAAASSTQQWTALALVTSSRLLPGLFTVSFERYKAAFADSGASFFTKTRNEATSLMTSGVGGPNPKDPPPLIPSLDQILAFTFLARHELVGNRQFPLTFSAMISQLTSMACKAADRGLKEYQRGKESFHLSRCLATLSSWCEARAAAGPPPFIASVARNPAVPIDGSRTTPLELPSTMANSTFVVEKLVEAARTVRKPQIQLRAAGGTVDHWNVVNPDLVLVCREALACGPELLKFFGNHEPVDDDIVRRGLHALSAILWRDETVVQFVDKGIDNGSLKDAFAGSFPQALLSEVLLHAEAFSLGHLRENRVMYDPGIRGLVELTIVGCCHSLAEEVGKAIADSDPRAAQDFSDAISLSLVPLRRAGLADPNVAQIEVIAGNCQASTLDLRLSAALSGVDNGAAAQILIQCDSLVSGTTSKQNRHVIGLRAGMQLRFLLHLANGALLDLDEDGQKSNPRLKAALQPSVDEARAQFGLDLVPVLDDAVRAARNNFRERGSKERDAIIRELPGLSLSVLLARLGELVDPAKKLGKPEDHLTKIAVAMGRDLPPRLAATVAKETSASDYSGLKLIRQTVLELGADGHRLAAVRVPLQTTLGQAEQAAARAAVDRLAELTSQDDVPGAFAYVAFVADARIGAAPDHLARLSVDVVAGTFCDTGVKKIEACTSGDDAAALYASRGAILVEHAPTVWDARKPGVVQAVVAAYERELDRLITTDPDGAPSVLNRYEEFCVKEGPPTPTPDLEKLVPAITAAIVGPIQAAVEAACRAADVDKGVTTLAAFRSSRSKHLRTGTAARVELAVQARVVELTEQVIAVIISSAKALPPKLSIAATAVRLSEYDRRVNALGVPSSAEADSRREEIVLGHMAAVFVKDADRCMAAMDKPVDLIRTYRILAATMNVQAGGMYGPYIPTFLAEQRRKYLAKVISEAARIAESTQAEFKQDKATPTVDLVARAQAIRDLLIRYAAFTKRLAELQVHLTPEYFPEIPALSSDLDSVLATSFKGDLLVLSVTGSLVASDAINISSELEAAVAAKTHTEDEFTSGILLRMEGINAIIEYLSPRSSLLPGEMASAFQLQLAAIKRAMGTVQAKIDRIFS